MITVRPTLISDVDTLCELQKSAFLPIYERYRDSGNPYLRGTEDILRRLDSLSFRYFTVLDGESIIGGVLYRREGGTPFIKRLNSGEYYLARIYIKPDHQCMGIGKKAILLCENELHDAVKFYVDFPKELEKNRKCYRNAGFHDTGKELEVEPGLTLVAYEKNVT